MKRCLLDLDGVLADFNGGACRAHGVADPYLDRANWGTYGIEGLVGLSKADFFAPLGEDFWANLEPTPDCFAILAAVEAAFGKRAVCILTSPVLTHGCAEGKIRWIRKHLPAYARSFLIGPVKEFCASEGSWLVDDSDKNVDAFRAWGGRAVLLPRPWNSDHRLADGCLTDYLVDQLPS